MELSHEFDVGVPVDEAWVVLTDLERIAPCLPGATLDEVDGTEYRGRVKVKVGPITAQYKGAARIVQQDDDAHVALVEAGGRDTRGQGNANASIKAELRPTEGGGTHVSVLTDLSVTGKVAQFGRGVMADVSDKLLAQFVENLERTVLAGADSQQDDAEPVDTPAAAAVRRIEGPEAEPVDLLEAAGSPVLARIVPLLAVAGAVVVAVLLLRRRRRRSRA